MDITISEKTREKNEQLSFSFVIEGAKALWPWQEKTLAGLVCCLAAADYASTVAFLHFSGNKGAYEAGVLASRAVEKGGISGLLLNDIIAVGLLILFAAFLRRQCGKCLETSRFSHAVFVFTLLPYTIAAALAVINNLLIIIA